MNAPVKLPFPEITSPAVFYAAGAAIVAYILYMMIRRRRGERPGEVKREAEL